MNSNHDSEGKFASGGSVSVSRMSKRDGVKMAQKFASERGSSTTWTPNETELEAALLSQYPKKIVSRSADGKVVAALSYSVEGKSLHVDHFGSVQKGAGSPLFNHILTEADKKGLNVTLVPSEVAQTFYDRYGFKSDGRAGSQLLIRTPGTPLPQRSVVAAVVASSPAIQLAPKTKKLKSSELDPDVRVTADGQIAGLTGRKRAVKLLSGKVIYVDEKYIRRKKS